MDERPPTIPYYPSAAARRADLVVHIVGLVLAFVGGTIIVALALGSGAVTTTPVAIYAGGFVLMFAFSLAYNFSEGRVRRICRRLDHTGIFLMIAGSYTPFTTLALKGAWAWGMTSAVWSIAGCGILGKLLMLRLPEAVWIAIYVGLGWIAVVAAGPIGEALSRPVITLLVIGGLLYTLGVVFHVNERLQFSRSIWHGHVLAGASVHWAAILIGTVLPAMSR